MKQSERIPTLEVYNPLDIIHLGESVMSELLRTPLKRLPPDSFYGAGVYALYYFGNHPLYASYGNDRPIYVVKAVPEGARKGDRISTGKQTAALYKRLREHYDSVLASQDLDERDFKFRCLAVDDIWIPLAESLLIQRFRPVWNVALDGFGIHNPGSGRSNQKRSQWDTVHPGRKWCESLPANNLSRDALVTRLRAFLSESID